MATCTDCDKKLSSKKDYKTLSRACEGCGLIIPYPFCMKCYRELLKKHKLRSMGRRIGVDMHG